MEPPDGHPLIVILFPISAFLSFGFVSDDDNINIALLVAVPLAVIDPSELTENVIPLTVLVSEITDVHSSRFLPHLVILASVQPEIGRMLEYGAYSVAVEPISN